MTDCLPPLMVFPARQAQNGLGLGINEHGKELLDEPALEWRVGVANLGSPLNESGGVRVQSVDVAAVTIPASAAIAGALSVLCGRTEIQSDVRPPCVAYAGL